MGKKNRKNKNKQNLDYKTNVTNDKKHNEPKTIEASTVYNMSEAESKLFEVLIDPENIKLNKRELSEKANISRPTLNRLLKKKEFMDEVNYEFSDFMFNNTFKIYQALFNSALKEGKDGFQDRKLILEVLGKYQESVAITSESKQLVFDINKSDVNDEREKFNTRYDSEGDL